MVSAYTEGMAQLLLWQLLNHHKLWLTVLNYVEIGVYLSTWDCNHGGAAAASQTAEPNPAARVRNERYSKNDFSSP